MKKYMIAAVLTLSMGNAFGLGQVEETEACKCFSSGGKCSEESCKASMRSSERAPKGDTSTSSKKKAKPTAIKG